MLQFPKKTCSLYTIIWTNMENNLLGGNTGWNSLLSYQNVNSNLPCFQSVWFDSVNSNVNIQYSNFNIQRLQQTITSILLLLLLSSFH